MKCIVQWIDSKGDTTPDDNEAVCLVQPFDPRIVDPQSGRIVMPETFEGLESLKASIEKYHRCKGDIPVDVGYALPCCEAHLKRAGVFWRALPLPEQEEKQQHDRVRHQPPPAVLANIMQSFPKEAEVILRDLRHDTLSNYWFFNRWGMHVGVEKDGYIHS